MRELLVPHFRCGGCNAVFKDSGDAVDCERIHAESAAHGDIGETVKYDFGFRGHDRFDAWWPRVEEAIIISRRVDRGNTWYLLQRANSERLEVPGWSRLWRC